MRGRGDGVAPLLRRLGLSETEAEAVRDDLVVRYAEPTRRYHTLEHVRAVLRHVEALGADPACRPRHPDAVELAVWFHDAVYEPGAAGNEAASAALLRRLLDGAVDESVLERAERLVLATDGHRADSTSPDWPDVGVLLDADLAVLAGSPAEYRRYVRQVREEFAFLSDDDWRRGRAGVLRELTARPLYLTRPMQPREGRARANVAQELAALEAS